MFLPGLNKVSWENRASFPSYLSAPARTPVLGLSVSLLFSLSILHHALLFLSSVAISYFVYSTDSIRHTFDRCIQSPAHTTDSHTSLAPFTLLFECRNRAPTLHVVLCVKISDERGKFRCGSDAPPEVASEPQQR